MAAEQIGAMDIPAEVLPGGKDDALWYAMGANKAHGLPMKRGDVKRAVELAVKTWPNKSQQEIAEQIGCGQGTVAKVKADIIPRNIIPHTRTDSLGRTRPTSYATRKPTTPEDEEAAAQTRRLLHGHLAAPSSPGDAPAANHAPTPP